MRPLRSGGLSWLLCAAILLIAPRLHAQDTSHVTVPPPPTGNDAGTDGHIHIVESNHGQQLGAQIAWSGAALAGVGIFTLFGELFYALGRIGSGGGGPPQELTAAAVAAIGGGVLVALVGLVVALFSDDTRTSHPLTDLSGPLRF